MHQRQHFPIFTVTPHGILMDGMPLSKSAAARNLPSKTLHEIGRIEELLKKVKKEDWDNPVPYAGGEYPAIVQASMRAALLSPQPYPPSYQQTPHKLFKDAGDDSDDGDDDDYSDSGDDSGDDGDYADSGNSHYNPDEPRIPKGQPGGGQWTTADNGTSIDSGSISADDVRNNPSDTVTQAGPITPIAYTSTQRAPISNNDDTQDIKTISTGIETDDHGLIAPASVNPDANGNPVNQANIFIGGAGDQAFFGNVENSTSLKTAYGSNYYFTNDSNNTANPSQDSLLNDFINNLPDDTTINIIGHSWGADTAAKVAVDNPGLVDTLITIDPVSHTPPNFNTVKSSVDTWVNVNAVGNPNSGIFSDIFNGNDMASIGGHWNDKPNGIASVYLATPQNHADFNNMIVYTTLPNGKTPQQMLNGQ